MSTIIVAGHAVTLTGREVLYSAGMAIDFDGCPNAYAPPGVGSPLDALANAGHDGNWWGLAKDSHGTPYRQCATDPFPGYFVATSALVDPGFLEHDPRRYFDGSRFPGISIPGALLRAGVRVGDLAIVEYKGVRAGGIIFDDGGAGIGEASPAMADIFGIPSDRHGGVDEGVSYRIFLGTRRQPAWQRDGYLDEALALAA